jgi:hypothetical protein
MPKYDAGAGQPGYMDFVNGIWTAFIGQPAVGPRIWEHGYDTNSIFDGIDCYAYVWRHEARHLNVMRTYWPNGPRLLPRPGDGDRDDLPDYLEPLCTLEEGGPFVVGIEDTNGNDEPDGHDYVYWTAARWTIGSANSQDWACPGHQTSN